VATSSKFRNGKLIRRTKQEQIELNRLKAERGILEGNATTTSPKSAKKGKGFWITELQARKLWQTDSLACVRIFFALQHQDYRNWKKGKPFPMPTEALLNEVSQRTLTWAITKLEKVGLISVEQKHRHSPSIIVL
jgi:hypothetical protein